MKYLIVGTGRCGTGYMSKILTDSGIKCSHEGIFTPYGIKDINKYDADSSWLAVPHILTYRQTLERVVHIVRHPLKIFRSWLYDQNNVISLKPKNTKSPYNRYIVDHFPAISKERNPIDRAAIYYLNCNETIANNCTEYNIPYSFFRVEDDPRDIINILGGTFKNNYKKYSKYNTRKTGKATAKDVVPLIKTSKHFERVRAMMLSYYPELEDTF